MKMSKAAWRALARETANIDRNEGQSHAIRHLWKQTGCTLRQAHQAVGLLRTVNWSKV